MLNLSTVRSINSGFAFFKLVAAILFCVSALSISSAAQTTEFNFQGSLKDGAIAANGNYDFEFRLFDALTAGSEHPTVVTRTNVAVANGTFAVKLDFFSPLVGAFPGADRYLEIRVKNVGGPSYTTLAPRQKIGSEPYSQKSLTADTATNALQLGGIAANQFVQTNGNGSGLTNLNASNISSGTLNNARLGIVPVANGGTGSAMQNFVDLTNPQSIGGNKVFFNNLTVSGTLNANLPSGDASYVQNRTTVQNGTTNFNVSGTGKATTFDANIFTGITYDGATFDASLSYNLGGSRFLSAAGTNNTFAGKQTATVNTGTNNSFFGFNAGNDNTTGVDNAFFGADAGGVNTNGDENTFVGSDTGDSNTTGDNNSFFGRSSGTANTSGNSNTFIGWNAGTTTTTGDNNTFIGARAREDITIPGSEDFHYATAIGAGSKAVGSNIITLGRLDGSDHVFAPGDLSVGGFIENTPDSGGTSQLCYSGITGHISYCSSSLRYKTNINRFGLGLKLIDQLKPISFDWKEGGMHDLGLGAEDVEAIEPLLVTYNKDGQVEGVKYDRIGVVLINAIKEQQAQIEALKKLVCLTNKNADVCKEK